MPTPESFGRAGKRWTFDLWSSAVNRPPITALKKQRIIMINRIATVTTDVYTDETIGVYIFKSPFVHPNVFNLADSLTLTTLSRAKVESLNIITVKRTIVTWIHVRVYSDIEFPEHHRTQNSCFFFSSISLYIPYHFIPAILNCKFVPYRFPPPQKKKNPYAVSGA